MPTLCKYMFIIIAAIQNIEKYCDIYFDGALGALLCLVCCDRCLTAHMLCGCYEQQQPLSLVSASYLATTYVYDLQPAISHKCHIKDSL